MRVAMYVRQSSEAQARSPEQQRQELSRLCKTNRYKVVAQFDDDAVSGDDTARRHGFRSMIEAAQRKEFDKIVCWDLSRFGRFDGMEAMHYAFLLRESKVTLETVSEGEIDWSDTTGRLMSTIRAEQNHTFLQTLAKNIVRGRLAAAKRGRISGKAPFGYDREFRDSHGNVVKVCTFKEKFQRPREWIERLIPSSVEGAVETVQEIFAATIAGKPLRALVRDLNARGVPNYNGRAWSPEAVRCVLKNQAYAGRSTFGLNCKGRFARTTEALVEHGTHEPLVSESDFEKAQAVIEKRRDRKLKPREEGYVLSGLLFCGECGGKMYGSKYRCAQYKCIQCGRRVDADVIEGRLTTWLQSQVEKEIARFEKAIKNASARKPTPVNRSLKRELFTLEQKIEKGRANLLVADSDDIPSMKATLREWKEQADVIRKRIEETDQSPPDFAEAVANLHSLRETLATADTTAIRKVLHAFISQIEAHFEKPEGGRFRFVDATVTRTDGSKMQI